VIAGLQTKLTTGAICPPVYCYCLQPPSPFSSDVTIIESEIEIEFFFEN